MMAVDNLVEVMRMMAKEIVEQCALVVEEIPASASLYESARMAEVAIEFKRRAAFEIRALNSAIE